MQGDEHEKNPSECSTHQLHLHLRSSVWLAGFEVLLWRTMYAYLTTPDLASGSHLVNTSCIQTKSRHMGQNKHPITARAA